MRWSNSFARWMCPFGTTLANSPTIRWLASGRVGSARSARAPSGRPRRPRRRVAAGRSSRRPPRNLWPRQRPLRPVRVLAFAGGVRLTSPRQSRSRRSTAQTLAWPRRSTCRWPTRRHPRSLPRRPLTATNRRAACRMCRLWRPRRPEWRHRAPRRSRRVPRHHHVPRRPRLQRRQRRYNPPRPLAPRRRRRRSWRARPSRQPHPLARRSLARQTTSVHLNRPARPCRRRWRVRPLRSRAPTTAAVPRRPTRIVSARSCLPDPARRRSFPRRRARDPWRLGIPSPARAR